MRIITSIVFEMKLPNEEVEVYKTLSDKERKTAIDKMKSELGEIIARVCVDEPNFTKFTMEIQEGE